MNLWWTAQYYGVLIRADSLFPSFRIISIPLDFFIEKILFLGILTLIIFNILMNPKGGGQKHSAHTF